MSDLVENLLGPRGGAEEVLEGTPLAEYITGILSPPDTKKVDDDTGAREGSLSEMVAASLQRPREQYYAESEEDDDADDEISVSPQLSPVLDPKQTPPSMGITFAVSFKGEPEVDICATWGRYAAIAENPGRWKRASRYYLTKFSGKENVISVGPDGKEVDKGKGAEISLHTMTRKGDNGTLIISIYMVNRVGAPADGRVTAAHCIFQPQIRIICGAGTRLSAEYSTSTAPGDDEENEVLYRNKRSLARGHMTSAVWRVQIRKRSTVGMSTFPNAPRRRALRGPTGPQCPAPYDRNSRRATQGLSTSQCTTCRLPTFLGQLRTAPNWMLRCMRKSLTPFPFAGSLLPLTRNTEGGLRGFDPPRSPTRR